MATSTTGSTPEKATRAEAEKQVATYLPGSGLGRGIVREITKKQAKDALQVDLENDLVWDEGNNWRVDVTTVPEALMENLKKDKDFKVSAE